MRRRATDHRSPFGVVLQATCERVQEDDYLGNPPHQLEDLNVRELAPAGAGLN